MRWIMSGNMSRTRTGSRMKLWVLQDRYSSGGTRKPDLDLDLLGQFDNSINNSPEKMVSILIAGAPESRIMGQGGVNSNATRSRKRIIAGKELEINSLSSNQY
jgi:hypothetical protein